MDKCVCDGKGKGIKPHKLLSFITNGGKRYLMGFSVIGLPAYFYA